MISPYKSDSGAQVPWEYLPGAAGTYQAGQLLKVTAGKLAVVTAASTTTPPYLCMADITVTADELVPVTRIQDDMIYETELSAAAADAKIGSKLQVAAGGTQVNAAAEGSFEVTYLDNTAAGSRVLGRFL
jgi:hypothetical protein